MNSSSQAAADIAQTPYALELRRIQMITEVGAEQNTTIIILMPSDFVTLAKNLNDKLEIKKIDQNLSGQPKQ